MIDFQELGGRMKTTNIKMFDHEEGGVTRKDITYLIKEDTGQVWVRALDGVPEMILDEDEAFSMVVVDSKLTPVQYLKHDLRNYLDFLSVKKFLMDSKILDTYIDFFESCFVEDMLSEDCICNDCREALETQQLN